jgi:hypothetical protein
MTIIQLQLNLWQQLEQAQAAPQATDWRQLCLAFDEAIDQTPVGLRLAIAADAIEQMADVLAARALAWAEDWYRQPGDGPVLSEDLFSEFVRQSLSLDLSELVAVPELYVRCVSEKSHEDADSVVEAVNKEQALLLAGADEEELEKLEDVIAQLEYDEDIAAWADAIRLWMQRQGMNEVTLAVLLKGTNLPIVKCWLALLLGGFQLRLNKTKGFYDIQGILIALPLPHPRSSAPPRAIAQAAASRCKGDR